MNIDLMNVFYKGTMVLLLFVSAIVITNAITKYVERKTKK